MEPAANARLTDGAPGPFYVRDECLACGAPEVQAPDLLAPLSDENLTTYFVRQPETPGEVERACRALEVCCLSALRYRGSDPAIIRRLGNDPQYCDHLLPGGTVPRPDWLAPQRAVAARAQKHWWQFWR